MKTFKFLCTGAALFSLTFAHADIDQQSVSSLLLDEDLDELMVETDLQELTQETPDIAVKPAAPQKAPELVAKAPEIKPVKEVKTELVQPAKAKRANTASSAIQINLNQVFSGSPVIYSLLLLLSLAAVSIWLYVSMSFRVLASTAKSMTAQLKNHLGSNQFSDALNLCQKNNNFFSRMISSGILSRAHGLHVITEAMKAEGKRSTIGYWQKVALLNDIAILAPMIGLLGTVLGMFYAFYDLNRSMESISNLFDGLGVSVGTTVAGLGVAILAMILATLCKYRLTRLLNSVENDAYALATLIDQRSFLPK